MGLTTIVKGRLTSMLTVFGLEGLRPRWPAATVCIGAFDGVHLGHQAVIRHAAKVAGSRQQPAIVLTFDRNPLAVIRPESCPQTILAWDLKLAKIAAAGADITVIAAFDHAFSQQSAHDFLQGVLRDRLNATSVVVGHDFACGKGREGTPEWLAKHIETDVLPPLERLGRRVSSTEIRRDILDGKVSEAAELLGTPFALAGVVVKGNQLGTELGVPTANLVPLLEQVIPKSGIYAGRGICDYGSFRAAISIGHRPAVAGAGFAIEAHLLDFPNHELYGRTLTMEFFTRIRDELWFESQELLLQQMRRDIESVREMVEV
jgi:riboflavin kinase/FMN adenylyltransferase